MPSKLQLVFGALAFLLAVGGVSFVYYKIDKGGYDRCYVEIKAASDQQFDTAALNNIQIKEDSDRRIREVYNAPESDNGRVAPVLHRVLEHLRADNGTEPGQEKTD